MSHTLAEYQTHLEKFGPELVLETAAAELSEHELSQLKALIQSYQRTHVQIRGSWRGLAMAQDARKCLECGLDLPRDAHSRMKRHKHCVKRAERRRRAAQET